MDQISPMIARFTALHPKEIDLSLDRIKGLLDKLGNPHLRLPPVIHVAGTNGKGSTCAFIRAILEAEGYRVHAYASPHLVRFNERFRIGDENGGKLVSDDMLFDAFQRAEEANNGAPITVFEITTAAGYILFSENPADYLILETGLGGRFDTTNLIDRPAATAISAISFDHERFLGETIEEIAGAKAGIVKNGVPIAVSTQPYSISLDVIQEEASKKSAPLFAQGESYMVWEESSRLVYQDSSELLDLPLPRLPGQHQIQNAGLAIATIRAADIPVSVKSIESGLTKTRWPGRMQRLAPGPLLDRAPIEADVWLDGGHNPGAGQVVAATIASMEERDPRPLILIAGMLDTKDPTGYFQIFEGLAHHVYTIPITSSNAGIPAQKLADLAHGTNLSATPATDITRAFELICNEYGEKPVRILVCGSLYLVGDVLIENNQIPD